MCGHSRSPTNLEGKCRAGSCFPSPAMCPACCGHAGPGLGKGRVFIQPGNSTCLLLSPPPSSMSRHEWAVATIFSPWDMFLFLIAAKAQVRRRQREAVNRAITRAAGPGLPSSLCCSAPQAGTLLLLCLSEPPADDTALSEKTTK